jgi:Cd2+/Zn2+-exporting ATPase
LLQYLLIVGCPCALILAAPTATVAALGRAAKAGILVKGGQYLERIAAIKAVFFDKTGTLTLGEPKVEEIACTKSIREEELLSYAASAEQHCTHPLARAILKAAYYAKVVVYWLLSLQPAWRFFLTMPIPALRNEISPCVIPLCI